MDLFVHDTDTAATTRVSVAGDGSESNGPNWEGAVSSDGRYVAFSSHAPNLVDGDTNGSWDVFVHDRQSGATTRVSTHTNGTQGSSNSDNPAISGDGRYVTFTNWSAESGPAARRDQRR